MAAPTSVAEAPKKPLPTESRPHMGRRPTKVAAIALANKTARTVWALMSSGERYRDPQAIQAAVLANGIETPH